MLRERRLMLPAADEQFFTEEQARHEAAYLAGTNPRQQSGFGRDARDWERFRRVVVAPIDRDASFLDIGCANGLPTSWLNQSAGLPGAYRRRWLREGGGSAGG